MTITKAFQELDSIRNNREDSIQQLQERVDAIGFWAAKQKNSKGITRVLHECNELADRLNGGTGHHGIRIRIV